MIIGNTARFGFEVLTDDLSGEFAEIYIVVSRQRVSGRNPVFLPTFLSQIEDFSKLHNASPPTNFDFSALDEAGAFEMLHQIFATGKEIACLTPLAVSHYHRLHSLDDAVDDWEIYVYDVTHRKHIVCREISRTDESKPLWSASLPRGEFLSTLNQLLKLFDN